MSRLRMTHALSLLLALSAVVAHGCAADEVLNPLTRSDGGGGSSASTGGAGGAGGQVTPFRTVLQRDPLGNVAKTQNLLWDGDFEWRPAFEDQYGWLYGATESLISFALPPLEMGARCKSGIKCARLDGFAVMLGMAVAFEGADLDVSVWSAPEDGVCTGLQVVLLSQEIQTQQLSIAPVAEAADEDGWCHHSGVVPERTTAQYLYIKNQGSTAIIDDVSIEPVEPAAMRAKSLVKPSATLSPQQAAHVRRWGRAAQMPRIAPPSEGQQKLQHHLERLMR